MNLIEAVKSGRPFRRQCWPDSFAKRLTYNISCKEYECSNSLAFLLGNGLIQSIDRDDLLADDYELVDLPE